MSNQRTICLCMIVKNEVTVIERCLRSVMGFIDRWVIVDTGSSDGTQALVRETLQAIPGELHERPWQDFGHNRSEALRLARGRSAGTAGRAGGRSVSTFFQLTGVVIAYCTTLTMLPITQ